LLGAVSRSTNLKIKIMDDKETTHRQNTNGRIYKSNNTYILRHSNEQSLIDTMFGVAMRVYDTKGATFKDREELGEWIRMNLEMSGFKTKPVGMAWAMLTEIERFSDGS